MKIIKKLYQEFKKPNFFNCTNYKNQDGSALIMSIVVLVIVAVIGSVGANLTMSDARNASTFRQGSNGFYAGESGIQRGGINLDGKTYDQIVNEAGIITDSSLFAWTSGYGDTSNGWQQLTNPKSMYQAYVPSSAAAARARSKLPGESGASVRVGAAIGGISNAVLETSRVCIRSQGFSPNSNGQVESRIERQIISYIPVQP